MPEPEQVADVPDALESSGDGMRAVLLAAKGGSREATAALLEQCREYLLLIANGEVPDALRPKFGASDLVQQSMAEAWEGFGRFQGSNEFELRGWLRNILLNNVRDAMRSYGQTIKRDTSREVPLPGNDWADGWTEPIVAVDPSPSACAAASEEFALVEQALARVPSHYAQIIRLRNLEYLSFAQISQRMEIEQDLARKLWGRAVKRLARELKQ